MQPEVISDEVIEASILQTVTCMLNFRSISGLLILANYSHI